MNKTGNYNVTKNFKNSPAILLVYFFSLEISNYKHFLWTDEKKNHIGKPFRAAKNFTLTLIINSYINWRNFTNFANFAKFRLTRKIISRGTRSWNLYAKDNPSIFQFTFFYSGKFIRWKIIYNLIAKVSFQILQSKLPVMLKDYKLFWISSRLTASGL